MPSNTVDQAASFQLAANNDDDAGYFTLKPDYFSSKAPRNKCNYCSILF
jgi:hypothetical protein